MEGQALVSEFVEMNFLNSWQACSFHDAVAIEQLGGIFAGCVAVMDCCARPGNCMYCGCACAARLRKCPANVRVPLRLEVSCRCACAANLRKCRAAVRAPLSLGTLVLLCVRR